MSDIDYELAHFIVEAALDRSRATACPVSVAILDRTRELVAFARVAGAPIFTAKVATAKAYASVSLSSPTHETQKSTHSGGPLYGLELIDGGIISTIPGGLPLFRDGELIGSIGVSGGTVEQDLDIAQYAAERIGG